MGAKEGLPKCVVQSNASQRGDRSSWTRRALPELRRRLQTQGKTTT